LPAFEARIKSLYKLSRQLTLQNGVAGFRSAHQIRAGEWSLAHS
jgi:hypothetical protein